MYEISIEVSISKYRTLYVKEIYRTTYRTPYSPIDLFERSNALYRYREFERSKRSIGLHIELPIVL